MKKNWFTEIKAPPSQIIERNSIDTSKTGSCVDQYDVCN